ncbi:putative transcriptional regulator, GntR family protein [Mycolicibacterium chitae]|uniref:Transcriptional regulator with HTH domain and aminotransferase domain n=1 Tax=Mycolicibacterium chitae TaxID=1792 RepID=A0A448HWV1_MYCCI|nr:PLP-dependent aminotransferase family protein [Mycolicibacterium chitae]MCV7108365.1 PLP-dependent aminotransferase family protein [Mycolicibacterium chitae]BBZ02246.1 putative transcriptional regulator, GntR family protein [Mycolicibacterium chitae]VEG44453.1 transcriptional regulator with HTH domain and aminotransferase domain [Mycolicibacterium chitae]
MSSWANTGARDLHLDLRRAITPGTRGVRDVLLTALRDAVRSGRLEAGTVLPPSRTLATDLGLSRNTVADAYAELVAEGWLAARQGAGTWVVSPGRPNVPARPRGIRATPTHNLMPGSPDVSAFPRAAWLASARRALNAAPTEALRMGDPRGRPELREALAEYLSRTRGLHVSAEDVVICAGTRHAVELLAKVFGPAPIAVEAYGLFLFRDCIAAAGARTVPIGVDEMGAAVGELDDLDVPAVLLTPAHHYPHGVPLHPSRRSAVVDWAQRANGFVLEDDYDGEFRYDRQPVGALQSLAPQRVVYLGSPSKSLSPVLRLGWMVVPAELTDRVLAAAGEQQWYVDGIAQLTMAEFIRNGNYDRHIRRQRANYRRRRDALVHRLRQVVPEIGIGGVPAGLHLLLTLPAGTEATVLQHAGDAGVAIEGLSRARHPDAGAHVDRPDGIVVNFGTPAEHAFGAAVDALVEVIAMALAGSR